MVGAAPGDEQILARWHEHAAPWTAAVREQRIESRRLVTDRAIVEAVLAVAPRTLLDLGCGEGWLARALAAHGIAVTGVDAVPALVAQAQRAGGGQFHVLSYEEVIAGRLQLAVDAVACNFSLLGEASVEGLLGTLGRLLTPQGTLLIQTLHPRFACGEAPYADGWRAGSWAGIPGDFGTPAPWYFRTMEGWLQLLARHGWQLRERREPLHPHTRQPASVIFVAQAGSDARAPA